MELFCKYKCKIAPKCDLNWNLQAQKLSEAKNSVSTLTEI